MSSVRSGKDRHPARRDLRRERRVGLQRRADHGVRRRRGDRRRDRAGRHRRAARGRILDGSRRGTCRCGCSARCSNACCTWRRTSWGATPTASRQNSPTSTERRAYRRSLPPRWPSSCRRTPATALDTHAREELGIDPDEGLGSPWGAAASSFVTFSLGALVPLVPFLVTSGSAGVLVSAVVTGIALLGVGAVTARVTGRSPLLSGLRMLAIGGGPPRS